MPQETTRLTAEEILGRVLEDAEDELGRAPASLAFSGVAAGLSVSLSGLGVAAAQASGASDLVAQLFYPIGFIAAIIGRAQLFTENTVYPVALVLDERRHVVRTLRLWVIVLVTNCLGALGFALLAVTANAVPGAVERALVDLGDAAARQSFAHVFASGIMGGWIIALVAWIVAGSHWTIGQVAVIWFLTFIVGIGHFAHSVATSGEVLAWTLDGPGDAGDYFRWLAAAALGNIVGGVGIVTLLNYGQVRAGDHEVLGAGAPEDEG